MPSAWIGADAVQTVHRERLVETLRSYGRVAVAFSGGIDSTVVAQAAFEAVGDQAIAVTAVSESLAAGELEEAQELARRIGIRHQVICTEEFADPNYLRNEADRCYFCKSELYGSLEKMRGELGADVIASGANVDDMGDYRPGLRLPPSMGYGTLSKSVDWARPTSAPWLKPGTCRRGTSQQHLACRAESPTEKK